MNNFHESVFNKIKDPIFIDNKKLQKKEKISEKGKSTLNVVYTIIDKLEMLFLG